MAKPNTPAPLDIICVIDSAEQITQPAEQARLEPLDLGRSTREYLAGLRVAINFLVEIHDDGVKSPFEPPGDRLDRPRIHFGPAHIPLQLLVALKERTVPHGLAHESMVRRDSRRSNLAGKRNETPRSSPLSRKRQQDRR